MWNKRDKKLESWKKRVGVRPRLLTVKMLFAILMCIIEIFFIVFSGTNKLAAALILGIPTAYMLEYVRLANVNLQLRAQIEELKTK